ncbi:MAG: hypothetical protein AAB546_00235 [Patescibacteria group bacterium]
MPKTIVQQVAKQIAKEPFEILKAATNQVRNTETSSEQRYNPQTESNQVSSPEKKVPDEQKLKIQSQRLMQALEQELEDIRKFDDQKQMQVQQQEVQTQHYQQQEKKQSFFGAVIAQGKKRRNMLGQKSKKGPATPTGTTKAEVRKPPSG